MSALTTALPVSAQQLARMRLCALALLFCLFGLIRIQSSKVRQSISSTRLIYQLSPKTSHQAACAAISIAHLPGTCESNKFVSLYAKAARNTLLRTLSNSLGFLPSSSRPFLVALG